MRRSVRNYMPTPVNRKTIEEILDIVRYAPTGMNRQDVRWVVVHDPARVKECARLVIEWMREAHRTNLPHPLAPIFPWLVSIWDGGRDPICNGAPHLLVAYSDGASPIAFTDAVIAHTTFDLVAPAFGLGTCWAGLFAAGAQASPAIPELLGLPAGHRVEYGMMFGRPKYHFRRFPKRNPAAVEWA
jgi:nitroreductase